MCSNCGTSLKFYEYLPLLSWVSTLGTCNYCGKRIDSSYTFLEAATGFSSTLLYHFLGFTESYILLVCITSILILKLLLYRKCQRVWLALTITFAFLAVALRILNEGTLYNCLLNIFLGIIILTNILKIHKSDEVVFTIISAALLCNIYIFLVYVIFTFLYFIKFTQMRKKKYLYYGSVLALLVVIFFNYVMPKDFRIFSNNLPTGFVYLADIAPDIIQDVKYATKDNFIGNIVSGYEKATIILTKEAAEALLQTALKQHGFGLKVFDGYRPVTAVKSFKEWALSTDEDPEIKARFYPNINKNELLNGYISAKSTHSRGSTVDSTIIDLALGKELDMGTEFDFQDPKANTDFADLPEEVKKNRELLRIAMEAYGFEGYKWEWWHFKLADELFSRYPEDHFDFPVK
ncbi:D-Ala-D-Ala dipeptidase [Hyalomma marginatum]|nr:D-Ala-D-Ala dipeptidase [Hyalomma marginatum]